MTSLRIIDSEPIHQDKHLLERSAAKRHVCLHSLRRPGLYIHRGIAAKQINDTVSYLGQIPGRQNSDRAIALLKRHRLGCGGHPERLGRLRNGERALTFRSNWLTNSVR
ncbi:MAG: hypothetical protein NVSMB62_07290 [Acidobacteriaceae bacterium]